MFWWGRRSKSQSEWLQYIPVPLILKVDFLVPLFGDFVLNLEMEPLLFSWKKWPPRSKCGQEWKKSSGEPKIPWAFFGRPWPEKLWKLSGRNFSIWTCEPVPWSIIRMLSPEKNLPKCLDPRKRGSKESCLPTRRWKRSIGIAGIPVLYQYLPIPSRNPELLRE